MNSQQRFAALDSLLDFLGENLGWEFDRKDFDDRFLLQKYVFFAQEMGFPTTYSYNVYVFGAYSPELAQDYYSEDLDQRSPAGEFMEGFRSGDFLALIDSKSNEYRWLEIASTLVTFYKRYHYLDEDRRLERAKDKTARDKNATDATVESVARKLSQYGFFN